MVRTEKSVATWLSTDVLILRKSLPNIYNGEYYARNTGTLPVISNGTYNICAIVPVTPPVPICNLSYINAFVRSYASPSALDYSITRISGVVLTISGGNLLVPINVVDTTGNLGAQYMANTSYGAAFVVLYTNFVATVDLVPLSSYIEVMPYSRDNYSPFVYNGSMVSQNQPVAYEVSLNSIVLPNVILKTGGRIAYYPYVYVEIENRGSASSNINTIYSNNPNTYKAIFKVPITDMNQPSTTPFVKLTGNGVVQTIPFKINCDMRISVKLPDGTLFITQQPDNPAGQVPNFMMQISCTFEINKI